MFFIKYASEEEETSVSLENLWRLLCVLDCIVGNVPFFFFPSKCAVLGDSVAVLEKSREGGVCSSLLNPSQTRGYSGTLWKVALFPLPKVLYLTCFRSMR